MDQQIVEMEMPFDKQKNQRKAFCFITFDSEQVVNELLKTPKQILSGKEVDVKKATPKPENAPMGMMNRGGNRSQRGGGRGGRGKHSLITDLNHNDADKFVLFH
jgi:squid-like protein